MRNTRTSGIFIKTLNIVSGHRNYFIICVRVTFGAPGHIQFHLLKNRSMVPAMASWAVCQHTAPLCFGHREFKSWLVDLS